MHHIDIHVRDLEATRRLFDPLMRAIGYELRSEYPDYVSYWRGRRRPSIGFIHDTNAGSAMMQLAFGAPDRAGVDAAGEVVRANGAKKIEGPVIHPEYGDDYYALFFEDADGNRFEIVDEATHP